jgi:hypothetical protein
MPLTMPKVVPDGVSPLVASTALAPTATPSTFSINPTITATTGAGDHRAPGDAGRREGAPSARIGRRCSRHGVGRGHCPLHIELLRGAFVLRNALACERFTKLA